MEGNNKSIMKFRVAASDTEFQGTISNPRYFEWFSRGRIEYYRECGALSRNDKGVPLIAGGKLAVVLTSTNCKFYSPGGFDDLLELTTSVSHLGEHSIVFKHELFNLSRDNALVARAEAIHVFLEPDTLQKAQVPKDLAGIIRDSFEDDKPNK